MSSHETELVWLRRIGGVVVLFSFLFPVMSVHTNQTVSTYSFLDFLNFFSQNVWVSIPLILSAWFLGLAAIFCIISKDGSVLVASGWLFGVMIVWTTISIIGATYRTGDFMWSGLILMTIGAALCNARSLAYILLSMNSDVKSWAEEE